MDHHVEEDPARDLDVGERRRRGIAADDVQNVRLTDLARPDQLPDPPVVGVEAPVEADLQFHARLPHRRERLVDQRQIQGDRLFTEDVLSGGGRLHDHLGVGVGARADGHGVDGAVVEQPAVIIGADGHVKIGGAFLGCALDDVRHGGHPRPRNAKRQVLRVEPPDPARADDAELNLLFMHGFLQAARAAPDNPRWPVDRCRVPADVPLDRYAAAVADLLQAGDDLGKIDRPSPGKSRLLSERCSERNVRGVRGAKSPSMSASSMFMW